MTGATLVAPRPARAIPDYAVNGAMATAGATAAAVFIRATSGRGDALPTPATALAEVPAPAEAEAEAAVAEAEAEAEAEASEGSGAVSAAAASLSVSSGSGADVSSLGTTALALRLLDEIPTWQKALAAGVPAAAVAAVIVAARKWSHLEVSKAREASLSDESKSLSAALVEVEMKLAAIVDERDEAKRDFESWKETMEKDAAKRDELADKKLQAAFAETAQVREELKLAKRKLEEVGLTKEELAKARAMNAELQRQLGEASEANMAELEKLHQQLETTRAGARAELEEALKATEALRAQLADAQRESREFQTQAEEAKREIVATKKDLDDARVRLETASEFETQAADAKKDLESARADLDATKRQLDEANERLERSRDAAAAEAEALRAEAERKLEETEAARAALEAWREEREAWEAQTKSNFLDMEEELREAKEALEEALAAGGADDDEKATLEAKLAETRAALEAAEEQMRDATDARADAERSLAEVKAEYERAIDQMETSQMDAKASEQALDDALAEARDLRAKLFDAESALRDAEEKMRAMREKADLEDDELVRELKATHDHQIWEMEQNMRALELTMAKTHAIARENAERMMRHNERMGRVVGKMNADADIPVKFEIVVNTLPGQRVAMVGTWNDWEVESAFPMRWTEGNLWTVTTPIHADDTYEYKYVIIDDNAPDPMAGVQWQMGNNRTLALQLSLHDEVVLVEVVDSWSPDPKSMPILLHELDGTIKEVGSTQLLRDCVKELRTEQAILDGSQNLLVLQEIAASLGGALPAPRDDDGAGAFDADADAYVDSAAATRRAGEGEGEGEGAGADAAPSSSAPSSSSSAASDARDEDDSAADEFNPKGDVTVMSATSESTMMNNTVALNLDISSASAQAAETKDAEIGPR